MPMKVNALDSVQGMGKIFRGIGTTKRKREARILAAWQQNGVSWHVKFSVMRSEIFPHLRFVASLPLRMESVQGIGKIFREEAPRNINEERLLTA